MIGSPCVYFSRNQYAITWVSNYRWPIYKNTHVIRTSIVRALMAFFTMFCSVFKTSEKRYGRFRSKEVRKVHFYSRNLPYTVDTIN